MPRILSAQEAKTYSIEKQVVEAELAKALYNAFNRGTPLFNLQRLARGCMKAMLDGELAPLYAACHIEDKLGVWKKIGYASPSSLRAFYDRGAAQSVGTFDASEVSDIIRLFGQWVEGNTDPQKALVTDGGVARAGLIGGKETDEWEQELTPANAVKDAYRPGVMVGAGSWKREVENVWGDQKGRFKGMEVARRDRGKGTAVEPHIDLRENKKDFAGIQDKRAKGHSNVLKIDRMFGLLTGADISGTTADTVYALEMLGADYLSAAYYMLPLATIVHKLHHSLLEVALALTLNGVIDYDIGFYLSLMPDSVTTVPKELPGLTGILQQYQMDRRNRCFVVYFSTPPGRDPAGAYLFGDSEVGLVRDLFNAKELLRKAPGLPDYPTPESLRRYFGNALNAASN